MRLPRRRTQRITDRLYMRLSPVGEYTHNNPKLTYLVDLLQMLHGYVCTI